MSEFKSGDKVVHAMFGHGVVADVAGSGSDARVTVDFASSVGRKKLLASVANLQKPDTDLSAASSGSNAWFEELLVSLKPRPGRRIDRDKIYDQVSAEVRRADFWIVVRERMRVRGTMPKVIDDPNGCVSVTPRSMLEILVRIRHESMNDARDGGASRAIFDELVSRILRDFEAPHYTNKSGINFPLIEEDLVFIEESDVGDLPARDSKMRPKRVQPKGVITSFPKRRDDY